jgi:FkbM family methyltransferase
MVAETPYNIIAYAQNAEDVVLFRAFADHQGGFFVDVGAGDPERDSLTKNLVDRLGWRGINIDPVPEVHERLCELRGNDVNLRVAVGSSPGTTCFYQVHDAAALRHGVDLSTLDPELASKHEQTGWRIEEIVVEVVTLESILEAHASRGFDLLKVDAEGREADVLASFSLELWRPRAMVIEATVPDSPKLSHAAWEPLVIDAGYRLALFDGLNRFYARDDESVLLERLSVPPNVFDRWMPVKCLELVQRFQKHG